MTQKMYFLCLKPALVVEGASCKVGRPHTAPKKKTLRGAETKQRIFNINVIIIVVIILIIITAWMLQPNKEEENISFL